MPCRAVRLAAILLSACLASPLFAQSERPLAGAAAAREGTALKISNRSDDPWVEMRIGVTERTTFDDASAYVCWGDRLDAKESLTTKLESCVNASGKRFDPVKLTPRLVSVAAHVPEHGRERSVFALR